ncbi:hypothetical protein KOPIIPEJ_01886 [Aeromonas dhakensis]
MGAELICHNTAPFENLLPAVNVYTVNYITMCAPLFLLGKLS